MPELTTETVVTHTLKLTDSELAALRNAARIALDDDAREAFGKSHGSPDWGESDITTWRTFTRLGQSPTRDSTIERRP